MKITFINNSVKPIHVYYENKNLIRLSPQQIQLVEFVPMLNGKISVESNDTSCYKNGFYYLNIRTELNINTIPTDGVVTITLTEVDIGTNIYLTTPKILINQDFNPPLKFSVLNKEAIKKHAIKKRRKQIFFTDIFEYAQGELLLAILIGVAIFYFLGWKVGLIYLFFSYWVLVVWNYLTNKSVNFIFKKALKMEDEKSQLIKFLNDEFLLEYLGNQNN